MLTQNSRHRLPHYLLFGAVLLGSLMVGFLIPQVSQTVAWSGTEGIIISTTFVLLLMVAIWSQLLNKIDIFSPLVFIVFVFSLLFFYAALLLLVSGDIFIRSGVPISELSPALSIAFLGLGAAVLGFLLSQAMKVPSSMNRLSETLSRISDTQESGAFKIAFGFFLLMFGAYAAWLVVGGISLSALNAFADDNYYGSATRSASVNLVFLLKSLRSWPLLLLLAWVYAETPRTKRMVWIAGITAMLLFIATGTRTAPLLFAGTVIIFGYLHLNKRPTSVTLVSAGLVIALVVGALILLRGRDVDPISIDDAVYQAKQEILDRGPLFGLMNSTYVFPELNPYLGISLYSDLLVMPIPRAIWKDKPILKSQELVVARYLPIDDAHATGMVGVFYSGFGPLGVFAGFLIFGFLCGWVYRLYSLNRGHPMTQILLSGLLPSIYIMMIRASPTAHFTYTLYFFGPFLLACALIIRRQLAVKQRGTTISKSKVALETASTSYL